MNTAEANARAELRAREQRVYRTIEDTVAENEQLRRENAELRKAAPVPTPALESLRDRQQITEPQLRSLQDAQNRGALKFKPGTLKEVVTVDVTGRHVSHFFGDISAAFGAFNMPHKCLVGISPNGAYRP